MLRKMPNVLPISTLTTVVINLRTSSQHNFHVDEKDVTWNGEAQPIPVRNTASR
jgi:hypothetical protein